MRTLFLFIMLSIVSFANAQVDQLKISDLQQRILNAEEDLTIVNFWATWCGPCIKEMPYFEKIDKQENIKVLLVSVDFKNQLDRVNAFVEKKDIETEVVFLDEKNPDDYMPKISDKWTGAIPATLFVNKSGKTYFHEKSLSKEELQSLVNKYL